MPSSGELMECNNPNLANLPPFDERPRGKSASHRFDDEAEARDRQTVVSGTHLNASFISSQTGTKGIRFCNLLKVSGVLGECCKVRGGWV